MKNRHPDLEDYLAWCEDQGHAKRTLVQYRHKILQFLAWAEGREWTPRLLREYRDHMQETLKLRPRTIRVAFTALRSFRDYLFNECGQRELPDVRGIKLPRMDAAQREVPTPDDMERMLHAAETMPQKTARKRFLRARTLAVLCLFAFTGIRRTELLSLELDAIDRTRETWRVRICKGKGGQSRWAPLHPRAQGHLSEWLEQREHWCVEHGCTLPYLFPVDRRRHLSYRGLKALWDDLLERAEIDRPLTPHCLRHYFAGAALIASGGDIPTVSALMGHSRQDTTLRYLHSTPERMREAVQALRIGAPTPPPAPAPEAPRRTHPTPRSATRRPAGSARYARG